MIRLHEIQQALEALGVWKAIRRASATGGAVLSTGVSTVSNFLSLLDTPDTYVGQSGKSVRVKSDETGLEFSTIDPGGATSWGSILGTLSDQTDLQTALNLKANTSTVDVHIADTGNPHAVSKTQVGLSAVTNDAQLKIASNLSDLNNVSTARTNLGLVIGTNVQAYSANLDEYAAVNPTVAGLALLDDADAAAQRATLGLGTMAVEAEANYYTTIEADALLANKQPLDADLTTIAANITAAGHALIDDADAATQRTTLGVVAGGAGDIWVEKAGDTMTGALLMSTTTEIRFSDTNYFVRRNGASNKLELQGEQGVQITRFGTSFLHFDSSGNAVFNEGGGNLDHRIEGDTDQNLVFVDASTDRVGIGTATPAQKIDVVGNILASGTIIGSNLSGTNTGDQDLSAYVLKALYDAHTVLFATSDNTPAALTIGEQTVLGRATGGNISAIAIDSDISAVSADHDTIPSAKATKTYVDAAVAAGVSDGDKGDITVSSSGAAWTIDNDVVTYAKMQNVSATSRILGRIATGAGDTEELTAANVRTIINVEDGADVTDAANVAAAGAVLEGDTSTVSMSFVVDEDDMVSNSATKIPTQQSVKAYVDANSGGVDTANTPNTGEIARFTDADTIEGRTAAEFKADVDLEIGTDLQAWSANLDEYAAVNPTAAGLALLDDLDAAAQIATLGLDADIATLSVPASTTISAYVKTFLDDADEATFKATTNLEANTDYYAPGGTDVPVADGGTGASTAEAAYNNIADMKVEPTTDDTANGPHTNDINAGATVAQWDCVYLGSGGKWLLTDADAAATSAGLLALALEAKNDTEAMNVALPGTICRNDGWTWATVGAPLYLSTTPGGITDVQPSGTDDVIRVVGYVMSDDCIWFDPANDYITHT